MAVQIQLDLDEERMQQIAQAAKQRGFANLTEYVHDLLNVDAIQHGEPPLLEEDDSDEYIVQQVQSALEDVKAGRVLTWEQVKASLKNDE